MDENEKRVKALQEQVDTLTDLLVALASAQPASVKQGLSTRLNAVRRNMAGAPILRAFGEALR